MQVAELPAEMQLAAAALTPISLEQLRSVANLQTRIDQKYIVTEATAAELVLALADDHEILELDGRRSFTYRSAYFDSSTLGAFRAHVQGRRKRFKCRTRHYVDSGLVVFELKLKGPRNQTIKHQLAHPLEEYGSVTAAARAFADEHLVRSYGRELGDVSAVVETHYRRVTLVGRRPVARVTLDFDLRFSGEETASARIADQRVVVETKSGNGRSSADRVLRDLGARPTECSKYCVGVGLLRDDAKTNTLKPLLCQHFIAPAIQGTHHG